MLLLSVLHSRFSSSIISLSQATARRASLLLVSCLILFFPACAGKRLEKSEQLPLPETVVYTPFPSKVFMTQDETGTVLTAVSKVTFNLAPDGNLRYDGLQEGLFLTTVESAHCPDVPIEVSDFVPFRAQAEVYLRPGEATRSKSVGVRFNTKALPVRGDDECPLLSSSEELLTLPFVNDADTFWVTVDGKKFDFTIPKDFLPYVLVRYESGAIIPGPARADTIVLDLDLKRLLVTYRSTIRLSSKNDGGEVRKLEFRAIQPDKALIAAGAQPKSREILRARATREFLRACPPPEAPGEICISPNTQVSPEVFRPQ